MLAIVQELSNANNNPQTDNAHPPEPVVNAAVQDSVQLEMLRLLREISRDRQGGSDNRNGSGGRVERHGGRSRIRKTPDNASFVRRQTDLYCWTHRGRNHVSNDCLSKANGHKNNATKANRMGGLNALCEWRGETKDNKLINDKLANAFKNKFILSTSVVSPEPTPHIKKYCVHTTLSISEEGTIVMEPSISQLPILKSTPPLGFTAVLLILPTHAKIKDPPPSIEIANILLPSPTSNNIIMAKGDSAASHYYWRQ